MPIAKKKAEAFDKFIKGMADKLPPEDYATITRIFADPSKAEAAIEYGSQAILFRNDYNQNNAALNAERAKFEQERAQFEAEQQRISQYEAQLREYEGYVQSNLVPAQQLSQINAEMEALRRWKAEAEQRVTELGVPDILSDIPVEFQAQTQNQGQTTQGEGIMPLNNNNNSYPYQGDRQTAQNRPTVPAQSRQGFDPNANSQSAPIHYATQSEVQRQINEASVIAPVVTAQLFQLNTEYRKLTGNDIPNADQLMVQAVQLGRPFLEYATEQLDLQSLREQARVKNEEAEIQKRVEARLAEMSTNNSLPTLRAARGGDFQNAPVMQAMMGQTPDDLLSQGPGQPGRAAMKAVEAFNQRKYEGQRT